MPGRRPRGYWGKRLGLLVAGILIGLAACELALRIFLPQPSYFAGDHRFVADPVLDIRLRPLHEINGVVETNSIGLRDREFTRKKPPGVKRVLCLGDSFTYGDGVAKQETWPKVLERALRERLGSERVEVINAGCPSWSTDQEWFYLRDEGIGFQPDMVIVAFFVGNDVIENRRTGGNTVINGECIRTHVLFDPDARWLKQKIQLRIFLERFHIFRALAYRDLRMKQQLTKERDWNATRESDIESWFLKTEYLRVVMFWTRHPQNEFYRIAWGNTERYFASIAGLCAERGIPLLVVVIPDELQVNETLRDELFRRFSLPPREEMDFDLPQKILAARLQPRGIPVLDLLPRFRRETAAGRSLYLPYDTHWNPEGHRLAVEEMLDQVQERLLASGAARSGPGEGS